MKVNEVVLESTDTYLRSLSDRLSLLTTSNALLEAFKILVYAKKQVGGLITGIAHYHS